MGLYYIFDPSLMSQTAQLCVLVNFGLFCGSVYLKTISKASGLILSYFEALYQLLVHDCLFLSLREFEPDWLLDLT